MFGTAEVTSHQVQSSTGWRENCDRRDGERQSHARLHPLSRAGHHRDGRQESRAPKDSVPGTALKELGWRQEIWKQVEHRLQTA